MIASASFLFIANFDMINNVARDEVFAFENAFVAAASDPHLAHLM